MIYVDKYGKLQDTHEQYELDEEEMDQLWDDSIYPELLEGFEGETSFYTETDYDNSQYVCINSCPNDSKIQEVLIDIMKDYGLNEEEQDYILKNHYNNKGYEILCDDACSNQADSYDDMGD